MAHCPDPPRGLSPQRGGFIPLFGHGGGYHPFGMILSPIFGDFILPLGGGVVTLCGGGVYGPSPCEPGIIVPEDRLPDVYMLCCMENTLGERGAGGLAPFPFQVWR